jgi:hypothetical protein
MNNKIFLCIFVVIVCVYGQKLNAQLIIPPGYLELTVDYYREQPIPLERIRIDFDGDGINDLATIVYKEAPSHHYLIESYFIIYLTNDNTIYSIKLFDNGGGVRPIRYGARNNVIQFMYQFEGTARFTRQLKLRYNHSNRKIQLIGYDTWFRTYGNIYGHANTSYNLLTGDYIINIDVDSPREHKINYRGNRIIEVIFSEEINDELLNQLDSIMGSIIFD